MPEISKHAIAQFLRTKCLRQLRLNLHPSKHPFIQERKLYGMPPFQIPSTGLASLAKMGQVWESQKFHDLETAFGSEHVYGNKNIENNNYSRISLLSQLNKLPKKGDFLIESEFNCSQSFLQNYNLYENYRNLKISFAHLRPDIIQVLPETNPDRSYINSIGEICYLPENDTRKIIRIIDIKLMSEPSPCYFAEVVYYSIILANWLNDNNQSNSYVVSANSAVWFGSHEKSHLLKQFESKNSIKPDAFKLHSSFLKDIYIAPYYSIFDTISHFLKFLVPKVLKKDWESFPIQIKKCCRYCSFLGFQEKNEDPLHEKYCIQTVNSTDHFCQIPFLSKDICSFLLKNGIKSVPDLNKALSNDSLEDNPVFLTSKSIILERTKSMLSGEAKALVPCNIHDMPQWADAHIYITMNSDHGSGISFGFGFSGYWFSKNKLGEKKGIPIEEKQFIVEEKNVSEELQKLTLFLQGIFSTLEKIKAKNQSATIQYYFWNETQWEQLKSLINRHMQSIVSQEENQHLIWIFPLDCVIPNAKTAILQSQITIVQNIVKNHVSLPIPFYYNLSQTALHYHPIKHAKFKSKFSVHPKFNNHFADEIPSECIYDIWFNENPEKEKNLSIMQETLTKQLFALSAVTQKIETDMYSVLNKQSPEISLHKPQLKPSWAFDSQLWYNFCLLDTAYKEIDNEVLLSKDPIDRELSFYSVRLKKRLLQSDKLNEALNFLNVKKTDNQYIFEVSNNSLESKIREGDFQCIISPESQPNLMNKKTYSVKQGTALEKKDYGIYCTFMKSLLEVSITAFNRERKLIALKFNLNKPIIEDLEDARIASFKTNSIIDPTVHDFFSKKLKSVLDTIGNPSNSNTTKTVANSIGIYEYRKPKGQITALSTFLWDPDSLKTEIISTSSIENFTSEKSISLNISQKKALNSSLSNSISLIWGPPGTGKSYVLSTIVPTCLHEKSGIKILICAGTYNAIDNIFLPVAKTVKKDFPKDTALHRLCSSLRGTESAICKELTIETNSIDGKEELTQLKSSLRDNSISEIVGATPEQIYKLLSINGKPMEELFDVIIIDEASQIDVSHAILAISSIKKSGKLIISGDPLQLSPIHSATPPEKIKNMVGSIFSYYQNRHKIKPTMLLTNYRSNKDIVSLTQKAGYKSSLKSYQPNLSIRLKPVTSNNKAKDYNSTLKIDQSLIETILDPQKKVCCFIYSDGKSKQQNKFETELISILTNYLNHNLNYPEDTEETFWTKRIGIVTPYRAQQASIINNLITLSHAKKTSSLIRMAVDTVERFQGQQRDIILASYSVGNPDYINSEENFILNLNRFNVMISRAKAKVFVLLTQELLNHLSSNLSILEESGYIKQFAFLFCNKSIPMKFSFQQKNFFGEFRYHNDFV